MRRRAKATIEPSEPRDSFGIADKELADLRRKMCEAIARRDAADAAAMDLCDKIMEVVKAEEGEDSEFYAALVFAGLQTQGGRH